MSSVTAQFGHSSLRKQATAHNNAPQVYTRRQSDARSRQHLPGRRHAHPASAADRISRPAPLLTIAEVLVEIQVARSTFDTWRSLGCAPECIKLPNGQIRIRHSALESWLAARIENSEAS